ncbi:MAG: hypothetical protein HY884_07620 [Deltaproteobacteria bacterium]|nr:hypothetical protein [Deltaproteobacteria bacterium]
MQHAIVITGIGAITPAGIGTQAFWDAVINGRQCFVESERFAPIGRLCAQVSGVDSALSDRRFRRAADISKYALVAIKETVADAGLDLAKLDPARIGLVMGITHGAINFTREFHAGFVKDGTAGASPMYFSDSVLNAPAGNVSIALNIKGPTHTVVGDSNAGFSALSYGLRLLEHGNVDVCFIGGAEELDAVTAGAYAKLNLRSPNDGGAEDIRPFAPDKNGFIIGEGACVLTLERMETAVKRGAKIYARIASADFFAQPQKAASLAPGFAGVDVLVSSGANGTRFDEFEATLLSTALSGAASMRLFCLKRLLGESFAPAGVMQTAAAALAINLSVTPPSSIAYPLPHELAVCGNTAVNAKVAVASGAGTKGSGYIVTLEAPRRDG